MANQEFEDTQEFDLEQLANFEQLLARDSEIKRRSRRRKVFARVFLSALLILGLALALSVVFDYVRQGSSSALPSGVEFLKFPLTVITMTGVAAGLLGSILKYLEPVSKNRSAAKDLEMRLMRKELAELTQAFENGHGGLALDEVATTDLVAMLTERVRTEAAEALLPHLQARLEHKFRSLTLERKFGQMTGRLQRETVDLARRGNLNLGLGMLTTMMGLSVLGWAVFQTPATSDPKTLIAYFLPRLSLVILIEVFAYFFLRLYKESLSGIKYFQNELTNVESRQIALDAALQSSSPELQSYIVQALSNTERNIILNKDQTTVELEREKMNRDMSIGFAEQLRKILKRDEKFVESNN